MHLCHTKRVTRLLSIIFIPRVDYASISPRTDRISRQQERCKLQRRTKKATLPLLKLVFSRKRLHLCHMKSITENIVSSTSNVLIDSADFSPRLGRNSRQPKGWTNYMNKIEMHFSFKKHLYLIFATLMCVGNAI